MDTAKIIAGGQYPILGSAIAHADPKDVRLGVVYGSHGQYVGTLELTPKAVWEYGSDNIQAGSMGDMVRAIKDLTNDGQALIFAK